MPREISDCISILLEYGISKQEDSGDIQGIYPYQRSQYTDLTLFHKGSRKRAI